MNRYAHSESASLKLCLPWPHPLSFQKQFYPSAFSKKRACKTEMMQHQFIFINIHTIPYCNKTTSYLFGEVISVTNFERNVNKTILYLALYTVYVCSFVHLFFVLFLCECE